jgi:hypothetical protein
MSVAEMLEIDGNCRRGTLLKASLEDGRHLYGKKRTT